MTETEEYQAWLEELAKTCQCADGPCEGCMQGSVCDADLDRNLRLPYIPVTSQ